ncbi:MAG: YdeI/OmpD-associated family protein [Dehalococcoidales bacterium]|nr:YdeI/OmpD-associated family protein [Dehalococcoidales bacterium]
MDIGNTLYVKDRKEWREWLAAHFDKEPEIWLIFPGKDSGKQRIPYNDAVEEALCFGWIDSIVKHFGADSSAQRFSPRKPNSEYSQANKERLKTLLKEGRLHPSVLASVEKVLGKDFGFPPDIIQAIHQNSKAWNNFQNFSPAYRRIRIAYIEGARNRPDEFRRRLNNFIKKSEQNKVIGYGGIEKYY